jgi:hypothetical protein
MKGIKGGKIMKRKNYSYFLKENGSLLFKRVIALTDNEVTGFKRFCRKWCTPSGNDNKNHFFIYAGPYAYHVDFIKTSCSGAFVKIKKFCPPLR